METGAAPEHLLSIDPRTGVIVHASAALERLLGVPERSLAGKNVAALRRCLTPEAFAAFVSNAAHDLVGPLNQSTSLAGLLLARSRDTLGEQGEEIVRHLEAASARMDQLARAMRRYLEVASSPPRIAETGANAALGAALYLLDREIAAAGARVDSDPLPALPADPGQLAALFEIVVHNAIKFRHAERAPAVHVSAEPRGDAWTFTIRDNGIGFSEADAARIFLPLVRLNGYRYPGAGMGLAIARTIVDAHGGAIGASSSPGGSAIWFTLPAAAPR